MPYYPPEVEASAHAQVSSAAGTSSGPTTTSASFVLIPEMTRTTVIQASGILIIDFAGTFALQNGDDMEVALFHNNVEMTNTRQRLQFSATAGLLGLTPGSLGGQPCSITAALSDLAVGSSHTCEVRWRRLAGTARAYSTYRRLRVQEL